MEAKMKVAILLIVYFLFTSGLVFEVTNTQMDGTFDTPFSLALSGERTGVVGIFSEGDMKAVEWLVNKSDKKLMIATDCNGQSLLSSYIPLPPRTRLAGLVKPTLADVSQFGDHFYIFSTGWMTRNDKYVEWTMYSYGVRMVRPIPHYEGYKLSVAYHSGDAFVYEAIKGD
jgi:hypothetical protein